MTKNISFLLSLLLLFGGLNMEAKKSKSVNLRFGTYNIRGEHINDKGTINEWSVRKDNFCKDMLEQDFDIVGMQEVKANQLEYIREQTGYSVVGSRGLFDPIFYKSDRFELLRCETFWLSESMEPFSKGWDGKYDRYCTWAEFRERSSGVSFFVFNTHLDHRGELARQEGAALICREAARIAAGSPIFICGDMNSHDDSRAYASFAGHYLDARKIAAEVSGPIGTFNGFGKYLPPKDKDKIDYIFVNDRIAVKSYRVAVTVLPNGSCPSDHCPVIIEAKIK